MTSVPWFLRIIFATLLSSSALNMSAANNNFQASLKSMDLALDIMRVGLTNFAILKHQEDSKTAAHLHTAASITSIIRNLTSTINLYNNPEAINNGELFALGSAFSINILDVAIHTTNAKNNISYSEVKNLTSLAAIRSTQILSVIATYLSHYGTAQRCQTAEFQTALHNIHSSLEAIEKMHLAKHYESPLISRHVLNIILTSNVLLNTASAGYFAYAAYNKPANTHTDNANEKEKDKGKAHNASVFVNKNDVAADFECPICLSSLDDLDENMHIVRHGCNHEQCRDCFRRNFDHYAVAELENANPLEPGIILRESSPRLRRMHRDRIYECPVCRQLSDVRNIVN